jgi:hypothetical protein
MKSLLERQPFSLDNQVYVGRRREADGRADLIVNLKQRAKQSQKCRDAELILHAYHAWEEDWSII